MADTLEDQITAATVDDADAPEPTTAKDSAPSTKSTRKRSSTAKAKPSGARSLERPLREIVEQIGGMLSIVEPFDGAVVSHNATRLAKALDGIAKDNPSVHRALSALTASGGWGGVMIAVGSIGLPIAAHHGIIPQSPVIDVLTPKAARDAAEVPGIMRLLRDVGVERPTATAPPEGVTEVVDNAPAGA